MLCINIHAQSLKELLNAKKQEAKDKAMAKADQKSSQAIDKAVESPETAIKKKKEKKDKKKAEEEATKQQKREADSLQRIANAADAITPQKVLQTNITCEVGKQKVEALLKKQKGVLEVSIDTSNGLLTIKYSTKSTTYIMLVQKINELGFEADGNKPLPDLPSNPCN